MTRRVLYVIDHQRPNRDRWLKPEITTTSVEATGDEAAAELADRFELTTVYVARHGCRVRLRVWPEQPDQFAFDPDVEPVEGTWIYEPQEGQ
jgi:hypothetical protein